ncbi:MAG: Ig-like domain-containing protein [Myxococcaceae bacterium]
MLRTGVLKGLPLFALALLLCGCPPSIDTGQDGGGPIVVTPEGGLFIRDGASFNIPKGAVDQETIITITVVDTGVPEIAGRTRISFGYRVSPTSTVFKSPIGITLPWIDDRIPQAVDHGTFDMRRQQGNDAFLQLPGVSTLEMFKSVQASTDKLGLFWVTSPSQANVAQLTIDPTSAFLHVGDHQTFTAKVTDPTGMVLDAPVTWTVAPYRVGEVDPVADAGSGVGDFIATDPGNATITATSGMMTATATVKVQGTTAGPSTFVHENPFPTGNDLWGGALAPGGLGTVFVGANGTVLTEDSGGQWTRLFSQPGMILKAVGGSNVDNAVAVGVIGNTGVLIQMQGTSMPPKVQTFASSQPRTLWYDGTYGMAVGDGNDVLMLNAGTWSTEYSPSFETLLSVVGDGAGGYVTLGSRGSIYIYDPSKKVWNSLYQTQLAVLLTAGLLVDGTGSEGYAVGGNKLWHFQNMGWTAINLPAVPGFDEATALGRVDGKFVIAGRVNKAGYILVYDPAAAVPADGGVPDAGDPDAGASDAGIDDGGADGGSSDGGTPTLPPGWTLIAMRSPQLPRGFFGGGPSSTVGYVVGDYGAVWKYGAGTFTELSRGFYFDVKGVAVTQDAVIAIANDCQVADCSVATGYVYSRVGPGDFELLGGAVQPEFGALHSVVAVSGSEVIVTTDSAIFRWDGNAWSQIGSSLIGPVNSLSFCGTNLYGAGGNGGFYKGTSSMLNSLSTLGSADLYATACHDDYEQWAAGDYIIASRTQGVWSAKVQANVNPLPFRAAWTPGPSEVWAFGQGDYGLYYDNVNLNVIQDPGGVIPDMVNGLWGSTVDNFYMVGFTSYPVSFGFALRFDGADWVLVDSGSQREVTAINGASPTEVWVGTRGGGVLHGANPQGP